MLFPTFTFALFFSIVYGMHVLLRARPTAWKVAMTAASAVFYGWWDPRFLGLIAGSIVFNWWAARRVARAHGKRRLRLVRLAVIVNLALLGFFKYWGFFVASLVSTFGADQPVPFIEVVLPVGISFYTFQALSYVIDVHRRDVRPVGLLDVAVFLSFFPQLVAGPIVRAKEFLPQLRRHRLNDEVDSAEAAWMIGRGLFKKVVIATYLAENVVDGPFAAPTEATRLELLQAMYGYAIQIYADFSGYTDIAIGVALLLGFRFPVNFDNPYRSLSIQDFWRRWHITLSNWLRDYLYIPLGGNRTGPVRTYINLALTMLLGGLWHGASWMFVIWGAFHGLMLIVHRLWSRGVEPDPANLSFLQRAWRRVGFFQLTCIGWIFFRSVDLDQFVKVVWYLGEPTKWGQLGLLHVLVFALAIGSHFPRRATKDGWRLRFTHAHPALQGAVYALVIGLAMNSAKLSQPFIYFQF